MASKTFSGSRVRAERRPARLIDASTATGGAQSTKLPEYQRVSPRVLSDVDAWALPFDLALSAMAAGGAMPMPPRGPRIDTHEVWS